MDPQSNFSRRRFVAVAVSTAGMGVLASSLTGCSDASVTDRRLIFSSLDDVLRDLDRLAAAKVASRGAAWNWPQTLVHCAQSIEYSITGFPSARSAVFQRTLGAAALTVFTWRGRMSHDRADPIPGAPALDANTDVAAAMTRLRRAIADFRATSAPPRPHFAYGELSKTEYEKAHAMHLANHFSAFDTAA